MSLRTSGPAEVFYRLCQHYCLPYCLRHGISPNRVTWAGLFAALLVAPGFWLHPPIGFLAMAISGLLDAFDGYLAKETNRASDSGAFLDSSLDRIADAFYLFGFFVLYGKDGRNMPVLFLFFLAMVFTFMISYTRARAEGLGARCEVGFFERGPRVLGMLLWALLICIFTPQKIFILNSGFFIYTILAFLTVAQRMRHVFRIFAQKKSGKISIPED